MTRPTETLLLVDDREANLLALEALLQPLQVRLVKASSGREALKFLLKEDCALILLDVQMPGLDGFETAKLIHARERTRWTPIIFVTAVHREESHIVKGYTHGAVDYLVKPLDPVVLVAKVRVFLEQRRREQALHDEADAHREQLHALFMQAPAAIAIVRGPEHAFELANPRLEEMVGREVPLGVPAREVFSAAEARDTLAILDAVYRTGEPFVGQDYPALFGLADRCFSLVAQVVRRGGRLTGVMLHAIEVTESVRARRKMEAQAQQLRQVARSKDEFLAMLGHELRNPLAPILTALQLMRLRAHEGDGRERAIIERQVKHLARLVDDLLDASRATMGKIELRREPLELSTAVERAVELVAPLIEQKRQRLTVAVPDRGLAVLGDPDRLAQVVGNLLNNAAKYTQAGGSIAVEARHEGAEVVVAVRDDGSGIAPERIESMFDLFVQDQAARSQGGLGIGLTLVRSLVQLHGGSVHARSEGPGHGSEFVVRLPAAGEVAPQLAAAAPGAQVLAPRRVLVVDDNRDAAEMLGEVLRRAGHEVAFAYDGLSALVSARQFVPEVVLLDLGLPGLDGIEVAKRLRAERPGPGLRIVALTGYGREDDRHRTAAAGIDGHLVKPAAVNAILAAMSEDRDSH